jgi:hypothetical protein
MKAGLLGAGLALLLALAACSEKPQGVMTRKADTPAYQGAQDPFVAPGWKVGDQASWQEQLRKRAQSQNEYLRIAGQ